MRTMLISVAALVLTMCAIQTPLVAQAMPAGTLLVNTRCTLSHGYSINDALEVARAMTYDEEDGPRWIGFRQAIAGNGEIAPNLVLRVVRWMDMSHWSRGIAAIDRDAQDRALLDSILDCDDANRTFMWDRNTDDLGNAYEGGTLDETLSEVTQCEIKEGSTLEDVFASAVAYNRPLREAGDRSTVQISHRFLGPRDGVEMGSRVLFRILGENAHSLAARIDATTSTPTVRTPEDYPIVGCGDSSLWRSHVVYWSDAAN
ncbi:MAG: hypothetical protein ACPGPI_10560 [Longimicrobiales bacterium]